MLLAATLMLFGLARAAWAQSPPLLETPIYDPAAKRYFALINPSGGLAGGGISWAQADAQARGRVFKGVSGRLAVIDSLQVHEFLIQTFRPIGDTWIGARYWCDTKQIQWSDGRLYKRGDFQAWNPQWNQDIYICKSGVVKREYASIAYDFGHKPTDTGTWIAKSPGKWYPWYFIEFPTGKP
jgi:hypothetical protein